MDVYEAMSESAKREGANDYTGPDGMLYCGVCGTRKTCRVNIMGRERVVNCICEHENEEWEARHAKLRAEARARRLRASFPASAYERMTFEADAEPDREEAKTARDYAAAFDPSQPTGLLFFGKPGSGKTFLAACIANEVAKKGRSVCFTSVSRAAQAVDASFSGRGEELSRIVNADLLVIDDLGTERDTPYMMEHAFNLVDGRYKLGKPLIVSTNVPYGEMQAESDTAKARIYSRIVERCVPVDVRGNRRFPAKKF